MNTNLVAYALAPVTLPAVCWRSDVDRRRAGRHYHSKLNFVEARVELIIRRLPAAASAPMVAFVKDVI
jgi:hypothetical protein